MAKPSDIPPVQVARAGEPAATPTATPGEVTPYVQHQIRKITEQLTRVFFGDYTAVVQIDDGNPVFGNLAMHINVAINAARNAIALAEQSEQRAAHARDEAVAAARAEARFLANVSHELRTPLASIRASAEILNRYPDESAATRSEFCEIILAESERLTRLIENVLDLGRIQSQQIRWDFRKTRVGDTVSKVVRSFDVAKNDHGVTIELRIQCDLPEIYADRDRLEQLWRNLVGNAIKFSGTSDRVWVDVSGDDWGVLVAVRDAGVGIAVRDQETVFDRFHQITSDTLTSKPGGTGLGLAISREIAVRHGGKIEIDSAPGCGSTFRVRLPYTAAGELAELEDRLRRESLQG